MYISLGLTVLGLLLAIILVRDVLPLQFKY